MLIHFVLLMHGFQDLADETCVDHTVHAFYLSVIEIDYPVEEGHTALKLKVFSDDLQNAISEYHHLEHLVTIESLCDASTEIATAYFNARIQLTLDGQKEGLILRSCRQEGDSHWLTFEVAQAPWKRITFSTDYFMELFPTQTHIVRVNHNNEKRFTRLTKGKESVEFVF